MLEKTKRLTYLVSRILGGKSIVVVHQDQEHWNKQFKRGKWRESEELGQNVGIIARMILAESSKKPIRVLDVGCGSGVLGQHLSFDGERISYTGIDISAEAIRQAEKRAPNGVFHHFDAENPLKLEGVFDVIVFAEMLYYCDFEKVVNLYRHYLREEGFVIISLYQTLRTKLIWQQLKKWLTVLEDVYVKDMQRNIGWRVRKCKHRP